MFDVGTYSKDPRAAPEPMVVDPWPRRLFNITKMPSITKKIINKLKK